MAKKRSSGLAAWVSEASVPILVVDERRRVRVFNRGAERFSGLTASDVIGRKVPERTGPADPEADRFFDAVGFDEGLLEGEPRVVSVRLPTAKGVAPCTALFVPLASEEPPGRRTLIVLTPERLPTLPPAAELVTRSRLRRAAEAVRTGYGLTEFVAADASMLPVLRRLRAAAAAAASLTVSGRPGSGRTHAAMATIEGPFAVIDAAALFGDEIPARLERIAQAGDLRTAPLLVEHADRLSDAAQDAVARHVYANRTRLLMTVDTRPSLTASLAALAGDIDVCLPRLRDRGSDVRLLAQFFLEREAQRLGLVVRRVDEAVMRMFDRADWAGEVAELKRVVEAAVGQASQAVVGAGDLPLGFRAARDAEATRDAAPVRPLRLVLEEVERDHLRETLRRFGGDKSRTAAALGISRPKLYHRLKTLGLDAAD